MNHFALETPTRRPLASTPPTAATARRPIAAAALSSPGMDPSPHLAFAIDERPTSASVRLSAPAAGQSYHNHQYDQQYNHQPHRHGAVVGTADTTINSIGDVSAIGFEEGEWSSVVLDHTSRAPSAAQPTPGASPATPAAQPADPFGVPPLPHRHELFPGGDTQQPNAVGRDRDVWEASCVPDGPRLPPVALALDYRRHQHQGTVAGQSTDSRASGFVLDHTSRAPSAAQPTPGAFPATPVAHPAEPFGVPPLPHRPELFPSDQQPNAVPAAPFVPLQLFPGDQPPATVDGGEGDDSDDDVRDATAPSVPDGLPAGGSRHRRLHPAACLSSTPRRRSGTPVKAHRAVTPVRTPAKKRSARPPPPPPQAPWPAAGDLRETSLVVADTTEHSVVIEAYAVSACGAAHRVEFNCAGLVWAGFGIDGRCCALAVNRTAHQQQQVAASPPAWRLRLAWQASCPERFEPLLGRTVDNQLRHQQHQEEGPSGPRAVTIEATAIVSKQELQQSVWPCIKHIAELQPLLQLACMYERVRLTFRASGVRRTAAETPSGPATHPAWPGGL